MYIETLNDVNFNKSWKNGLVLKPLTGSVGINREYIFNFESICKYLCNISGFLCTHRIRAGHDKAICVLAPMPQAI